MTMAKTNNVAGTTNQFHIKFIQGAKIYKSTKSKKNLEISNKSGIATATIVIN